MYKCCGKEDCKLLDKCCGKKREKSTGLADAIDNRPAERITERVIVQLAEKCPPDCNCGG